ncbi:MAG: hypothetical protein Tp176DCM1853251_70 [Prokaryotic dsDNA virus sp.]|nr:MAG: hypothetical protein Tp176DCM1853251_70 [Prokaryotic dsDNA virus sp.]|tara:strand:- start:5425 stop:5898 length:474 start_codon:yes stop_codon:yes gene_type:complete
MPISLSELGIATAPYPRVCYFSATIYNVRAFRINWSRCMRGLYRHIDTGIPQHNDGRFVFTVYDENGDEEDITSVTEIEWIVARSRAGTPLLTKTLTGGGVQLTGTASFYFDFADTDSGTLGVTGRLYHECRLTLSTGEHRTAFAGAFEHRNMVIGD